VRYARHPDSRRTIGPPSNAELPKEELRAVIEALADDSPLPERCRPHMLSGNWVGHWECHIRSDWLLIYKLTDEVMVLTLVRTATLSDLFDE
jgi:mRNA interferase YafQ